ncbi:hypothetical protein [Salibacterium sp. K-3]
MAAGARKYDQEHAASDKAESLMNHLLFLSLYKAAREKPAKTITPPAIVRRMGVSPIHIQEIMMVRVTDAATWEIPEGGMFI